MLRPVSAIVYYSAPKDRTALVAVMASSAPVAIVTGGNSGMGMGIVRQLVKRGWKVAIADINENKEFAEELGEASSFHKCNVADYDRFESRP